MLTWNAEKVENFKEKNEKHPGFLDCFVWATMAVGLNSIKESNIKEWVYRTNRMKFEGHPLFIGTVKVGENYEPKELDISEDDVRMWIGLRTNASPLSSAAFDKMLRERREKRT